VPPPAAVAPAPPDGGDFPPPALPGAPPVPPPGPALPPLPVAAPPDPEWTGVPPLPTVAAPPLPLVAPPLLPMGRTEPPEPGLDEPPLLEDPPVPLPDSLDDDPHPTKVKAATETIAKTPSRILIIAFPLSFAGDRIGIEGVNHLLALRDPSQGPPKKMSSGAALPPGWTHATTGRSPRPRDAGPCVQIATSAVGCGRPRSA
jgi:hypothetical protein